jgi:D-sedoheptulose 7-phosphate isomerase
MRDASAKAPAGAHAPVVGHLEASIAVLESSIAAFDDDRVERAIGLIVDALRRGLPLLVCGNGGSAADAQHITGELVGRFHQERRAINAICLSANPAAITAWANDHSYDEIFARQIEAHAPNGGALLALSTSGNSANVIRAAETARRQHLAVVSLTGKGGGRLAGLSDVLLDVPSTSTPMIQQVHICLYHHICERIEAALA